MDKPDNITAPDFAVASRYVELLRGSPNAPINIRMLDDARPAKLPAIMRRGTLAELWPEIVGAQGRGYGVFAVVNEGGNSDADIKKICSAFTDGDDIPIPGQWHLRPSFIVRRDETHWHAYWKVSDLALDAFEIVQKRLAAHYGSDPKVCNRSRVMRLPGTLHQKGEPCLVTLQISDDPLAEEYTAAEIVAGLPAARKMAHEIKAARSRTELDKPENIEAAIRHVTALAKRGDVAVAGQGGNRRTYNLFAEIMDHYALSQIVAFEIVRDHWNEACNPPWSDDELAEIVQHAAEYMQNEPGASSHASGVETFGPTVEKIAQDLRSELLETTSLVQIEEYRKRMPSITLRRAADLDTLKPIGFRDSEQQFIDNPDGVLVQTIGRHKSYKTTETLHRYKKLIFETGAHVAYNALEGAYALHANDMRAILQRDAEQIDKLRGNLSRREWLDAHFHLLDVSSLQITDDDHRAFLIDYLRNLGEPFGGFSDLVIDTQGRLSRGQEENSAKEMGLLSEAIEMLRRELTYDHGYGRRHINICLLHHVPKHAKAGELTGRGSNVIAGDFDEIRSIEADKKKRIARVRIMDRKGAPDGQVFHYRAEIFVLTDLPPEWPASTGIALVPIDVAEFKRLQGKTCDSDDGGLNFNEVVRARHRLISKGWKDPHQEGMAPVTHSVMADEIMLGRGLPKLPVEAPRDEIAARETIYADILQSLKNRARPERAGKTWGTLIDRTRTPLTWTNARLPQATLDAALAEPASSEEWDDEGGDDED